MPLQWVQIPTRLLCSPCGSLTCIIPPGNEVDQQDLSTALVLVKDLISTIDQEVHDYEKNARLQEIYGRLDGRTKAVLPWDRGPMPFRKEEILRRKLVHDGCMLWKTAGRFKGGLSPKSVQCATAV